MNINVMRNQGTDGTLEPAYFARKLLGVPSDMSDEEFKKYIKAIVGEDVPSSALNTPEAFEAWLHEKGWSLKDLAVSSGGATTIISYVTSIIGIEVPSSVKNDPDALLAWLREQDDGKGIDLNSLAQRINAIESNLLTDDDIDDIVGSLP